MGLGAMWLPLRVRDCALCAVLALLMLFVLQCALEQFLQWEIGRPWLKHNLLHLHFV